jgi:hypothetical protein
MINVYETFGQQVIELIEQTPNNMELGDKVRLLYFELNINKNKYENNKRNDSGLLGRQETGDGC